MADGEAAAYFFHDLAQHNDAEQAVVLSVVPLAAGELPGLPAPATAALLTGQQAVAKGRQGAEALNKVHVTLCALRLPDHGSDLLLTLNMPIFISEHSAAAATAGGRRSGGGGGPSQAQPSAALLGERPACQLLSDLLIRIPCTPV